MIIYVLYTLFLACTVNAAPSTTVSPNCPEGVSLSDGKTSCTCKNGKVNCIVQCDTLRPTDSIQPLPEKKIIGPLRPIDFICEEGSSWYNDCNLCTCTNGVPVCEQQICSPQIVDPPIIGPSYACIEGTSWYNSCNLCNCHNGKPICETKPCPLIPPSEVDPSVQCVEGLSWNDGCSACTCKKGIPLCSQKLNCYSIGPVSPVYSVYKNKKQHKEEKKQIKNK